MDTKEESKIVESAFTYKTRSLFELATCLSLGAELTGRFHENPDDKFYTFVLKAGFDMEKTVLQLASRTLVGNVYDVLEAYQRAKSIVHAR